MKKRGQVTLFVIIGMVLLIAIALIVYLTQKTAKPDLDVPRLTGDAGEVQEFVEGCIEQTARDGLRELGRHGGYIDPTDDSYSFKQFDYDQINQAESDLAFLNMNDEKSGVPYWYYAKSSGCWHCDVASGFPSVELMSYQLGKYVDENLKYCLDDFYSFKEQGIEITSMTNASTLALINEESVGFLTQYEIRIVNDGEMSEIKKFYREVDIPLIKYYQIATKITQKEIDTEYLDYYGLYLLGQYNGLDGSKLPPISAFRVGYSTVFWSKMNTRLQYQSLLSSYTPFFRIKGTSNYINYTINGGPLETKMYNAMQLPIFTDDEIYEYDLKNKEINHIYAGQPIYLNVRPSNGDLIFPISGEVDPSMSEGILASMEPEKSYDFYYDISYPVIVEITDPRPGSEYTFMFALQGNIKENKMMSDWISGIGTIPWSSDYMQIYTDVPIGTEAQDMTTGETYTYESPQTSKSMFCDANQRISGNIRLKTYDSISEEPLEGVAVRYHCGLYSGCQFGETKYNSTTDEASFQDKLPVCVNGYVQLTKDGYLSKKIPLTTQYQKSQYLGSFYLEKVYEKNVTIRKFLMNRDVSSNEITLDENPLNLSVNDTVMITVSKIPIDDWDTAWTQSIIAGRDNPGDITLKLVPGRYTIDANLMDYNGLTIHKECKRIKVKGGDDVWIPEEDLVMPVAMWGGVGFDYNDPFFVTADDLIDSDFLTFNIIRAPDPLCLDDMDIAGFIETATQDHREKLYPTFNKTNEIGSNDPI